jgi:hypothetical protein
LYPLWTKLVAKCMEGLFLLCLGGKGTTQSCKSQYKGGATQQSSGESQALHCLGETGSKLILTASPREKLISNSQSCPVSGMGWQLLIHQPLMGPLLRTCLLQSPCSTKKAQAQAHRTEYHQSCPIGKSKTHCHTIQHTNLE